MFCANCGTKIEEGERFCTGCGKAIVVPNEPVDLIAPHQPAAVQTQSITADKKPQAIASLVLGIAGLGAWFFPIAGFPVTIIGLIMGVIGQKSSKKGMAVAGLTLSIMGLVATIVNSAIGVYMGATQVYTQVYPMPNNMVRVNGGTFMMGSPTNEAGRDSDEVQHSVTVSSFYMGIYEVTQKEYQEVMGTNPSAFKVYGDNNPVQCVSWFDAVEYCNRRSRKEGLTPVYSIRGLGANRRVTWNQNANGYRLPTEAEWEYACRAGTTTPFSTGNNITTSQANYDGNYPYNGNAKGTPSKGTTAVGSFAPNPWGLYDMHGNVDEWCWDWYDDYSSSAQTDPKGASLGYHRPILRGGSWRNSARLLRSANRSSSFRSYYDDNIGFRIVRN